MSQVAGACEVQQLSLQEMSVGNASHAHGEECLIFCTHHPYWCLAGQLHQK